MENYCASYQGMYPELAASRDLGASWRYSDSTSDTESCASDYTADCTIHSADCIRPYLMDFRPPSAHEPPIPANFLQRQSSECDSEYYTRPSEGVFVHHSAGRRKSTISVTSERSGYVSSHLPSPRRQHSDDLSGSEHSNQRHTFCRLPYFGRSSSANSSTVFDWSGLANGRRRDSITSQTSEYSAYASGTSPRRRNRNRRIRHAVRPQARWRCHDSVFHGPHSYIRNPLECHNEQDPELRRSICSSVSSGNDFTCEHDQRYDSEGATSDLSSFSEEKYPKSSCTESIVHQSSCSNNPISGRGIPRSNPDHVPRLFIPPTQLDTMTPSQSLNTSSLDGEGDDEMYELQIKHLPRGRAKSAEGHACRPGTRRHATSNNSRSQIISRPFAVLQGEDAVKSFTRNRSFLAKMKSMFV